MSLQRHYHKLVSDIDSLLLEGKARAINQVNTTLVETYWHIGQRLVEFEQDGNEKAEYGSALLKKISKDLTQKHGRGFSRSNLQNMRLLYLKYPKCQTLSGKLSWSHYTELLALSDDLAFSFYAKKPR